MTTPTICPLCNKQILTVDDAVAYRGPHPMDPLITVHRQCALDAVAARREP